MFDETVALAIYNNTENIKRVESFELFKQHILHGLELLKNREVKKISFISDVDRKDIDLALKYNIQLMNTLLAR